MSTAPAATATHAPRHEAAAASWVKYPERGVTYSTGTVHVMMGNITVCGTAKAARGAVPDGTTPTCRNCGAEPITAG